MLKKLCVFVVWFKMGKIIQHVFKSLKNTLDHIKINNQLNLNNFLSILALEWKNIVKIFRVQYIICFMTICMKKILFVQLYCPLCLSVVLSSYWYFRLNPSVLYFYGLNCNCLLCIGVMFSSFILVSGS
jgi:hypothetical protein